MEKQEIKHFNQVITTFYNYHIQNEEFFKKKFEISQLEKDLFPFYPQVHHTILQKSQLNQKFLCHLLQSNKENGFNPQINYNQNFYQVNQINYDKIKSTLKQFVRQWSKQGNSQRVSSYQPILFYLKQNFLDPSNIKVLVPGCGLGRLVYQIAKLGFLTEGNEFTYFMLLCSFFIFNCSNDKQEYTIYPYIHNMNHCENYDQIFTPIRIPDIKIESLKEPFSMAAGQFTDSYRKEEWNVVVTCFFLDTAHNVLCYIEKIREILLQGGIWINNGPLLYHYEHMKGQVSIELAWWDIEQIINKWFTVEHKEYLVSGYCANKNHIIQYKCIFFVARKITI